MPPIERWPTGGYLSRLTTSRASAGVSTCGITIPSAPLSSARVAIAYSPFGTRAIGAMPASKAAVEICAQASSDITPCSISRNSQSNPATAIALAISTLRVMRTPTPSDSWPCSSFSRATLRTMAGIGISPSVSAVSTVRFRAAGGSLASASPLAGRPRCALAAPSVIPGPPGWWACAGSRHPREYGDRRSARPFAEPPGSRRRRCSA